MVEQTKHLYWRIRQFILRKLIPEIVWPKYVVFNGAAIEVRGMPFSFGVKLSLTRGTYEKHERDLLTQVKLDGKTVVEMGASLAVLTRIIAHRTGPKGGVVAVEASPAIAKIAEQVTQNYPNIKILEGIAFPTFQVVRKERFESFQEAGGSLGGKLIFSDRGGPADKSRNNVFDLKTILSAMQEQPSVLICDIEGAERVLLDSPPGIPSCIDTILIELHPSIYGSDTAERILEVLKNEGLKVIEKKGTSFLMTRAAIS